MKTSEKSIKFHSGDSIVDTKAGFESFMRCQSLEDRRLVEEYLTNGNDELCDRYYTLITNYFQDLLNYGGYELTIPSLIEGDSESLALHIVECDSYINVYMCASVYDDFCNNDCYSKVRSLIDAFYNNHDELSVIDLDNISELAEEGVPVLSVMIGNTGVYKNYAFFC
jgi:hypothetical protein